MKKEPKKGEEWRKGYQQGVIEATYTERKAFTEGLRCLNCGQPKEFSQTSDTCHKCWEEC